MRARRGAGGSALAYGSVMAELIAGWATANPGGAALVDERGTITWAQFDDRVNRLINGLRDAGLQPGDTFAVMCGNQHEFFEASAASAHGGWTMVPVNWHWVADELAYVLEDSGATALIVDVRWLEVAVEACARVPSVTTRIAVTDGPLPDGFISYEELLASASPAEPADQERGGPMFYTSGTTGFPKGVRSGLTHPGGPVSTTTGLAEVFLDLFGVPKRGVTLLCGPVYHSAQWVFSMLPLAVGSTVVMQHQFDPAALLDLIERFQVTNTHLVPTQFVRLLKLSDEVRADFDASSLVSVVHGAAPCPPEVKKAMIIWWGPKIVEYYGGTEGGFISLIGSEEWLDHRGSVGRVLPIVEVTITDDDGHPLGPNETGQIWFRSLLGNDFEYHNAPEKTAEAHLAPGVGTLGDVGFLDEDGYLYMADRKIDMIISGGVNIYPAEIEAVLVGHPKVVDAAVFGIPHDEMGEEVKAAVQLVPGVEPSSALFAELTSYAREHLAGYKVPRSIDIHPELPRNEAGKLQKRTLRDRYWQDTGRSI